MASKRNIGVFGILALVAMRLAVGWHFYDQGMEKFEPGFSAENFLRAAKGPLADRFQELAQGVHGVDTLLFVARRTDSLTDPQRADQAELRADYDQRRKAADEAGEPIPVEAPPHTPSAAWLEQITADWQASSTAVANLLSDADGKKRAGGLFQRWQALVAEYLAGQDAAIAEHQHELWRLEQIEADARRPGSLPYNDERVATKQYDTFTTSRKWVADVRSLEELYQNDLIALAAADGVSQSKARSAVRPWTELDLLNRAVKWTVLGVGVCLVLGFATRLAALVGAAFLASVIATQPPWIPGAETTYFWYQLVEVTALLAIAVFGAGRWLGLDAMWKHLWPAG